MPVVSAAFAAAAIAEESASEADSLGMTFATINPELRERFGIDEGTTGVVVVEVEPEGAAAERGIRPGDVIVEVGLEEVSTPADVVTRVNKAGESNRKSVLLLLDRSGDQRFVAVELATG